MRIGLGAFLGVMILASGAAFAGGPFDGTWNGELPSSGGKNGCPSNTISATVTNGKLEGSYEAGRFNYKIRGTVGADGKLINGFMANIPLEGTFSGNEFTGSYSSSACNTVRRVTLHKG